MKRTKGKTTREPSAILTADWHLREDTPICRTDDFWETQWAKVEEVRLLAEEHDCPVLHAGDLFGSKNPMLSWRPSPYLLSTTLQNLPKDFFTIYGNHDLPQHSLELYYKSGVTTLVEAGALTLLPGAHWGQFPKEISILFPEVPSRKVCVWHVMTWANKAPWPGCEDPSAEALLDQYPQFDLILTGHHHRTFVVEKEGRILVNPGSLTRQAADQEKHRPCVFFWYAKDNSVEPYYLDAPTGVISREHLDRIHNRDSRIEAFVERLGGEWEAGINFETNLERFISENKVRKSVEQIVWRAIE